MRTRTYKTSYAELVALTAHRSTWAWVGAGLALLACAPLVMGSHGLNILATIFVMAIGILGLNLLTGVTGLISLGHAGFLLIGAYAQAILTTDYHLPAWLAIFASGAVAAIASLGRAWLAVRDHDIAARAMGISLMRYKLLAFMVSAFYTGVAGALVALHTRYINVDTFSILISIEALAMVIVGGMGRVHGALLGTALILVLPELLNFGFSLAGDRFTTLMADRIYEVKGLLYGVVILLFLRLEPEGLAGIWRKAKRFWVHWPLSQ